MDRSRFKTNSKFKVYRQKQKLFRTNDPLLSVLMWGVNFTSRELENVHTPVMLLPDHFKAHLKIRIDNQNFNRDAMPSHFKVKEYCPLVFQAIRKYWKITDSSFRNSLVEPPTSLNVSEKSNINYYESNDRRFILKCISKEEAEQMHNLLPEYHRYIVECEGDTLLPHFCAMYRLTVSDKETCILIMRNIFPSKLKIHFKYNIKGLTVDRSATDKEKLHLCSTLQDNHVLENKCMIYLDRDEKKMFTEKLQRDIQFLVDQHKMDYSLLVGVHDLDQGGMKHEKRASIADFNTSDLSGNESYDGSDKSVHIENHCFPDELFHMRSLESSTRRELYSIGIINILKTYNRRKKGVYVAKRRLSVSASDQDESIIARPDIYARRFHESIEQHVI